MFGEISSRSSQLYDIWIIAVTSGVGDAHDCPEQRSVRSTVLIPIDRIILSFQSVDVACIPIIDDVCHNCELVFCSMTINMKPIEFQMCHITSISPISFQSKYVMSLFSLLIINHI